MCDGGWKSGSLLSYELFTYKQNQREGEKEGETVFGIYCVNKYFRDENKCFNNTKRIQPM